MIGGLRDTAFSNEGTVMRRLLAALWLIALVSDVSPARNSSCPALCAARRPTSRRRPSITRWGGFYGGADFAYAPSSMTFGSARWLADRRHPARSSNMQNQFRPGSWIAVPQAYPKGQTFGGFVGYNSQWDDIVLGVEFSYQHALSVNGIGHRAASNASSRSRTTSITT